VVVPENHHRGRWIGGSWLCQSSFIEEVEELEEVLLAESRSDSGVLRDSLSELVSLTFLHLLVSVLFDNTTKESPCTLHFPFSCLSWSPPLCS